MEPETFSAFNEEPYRELQNENDQGQWNAGTLSKYALFFLENKRLDFYYWL